MITATRPTRARHRYTAIALTAAIAPLAACSAPATETPATATPGADATSAPDSVSYADGEYRARGWYGSLPSHQDVTLTIEDGTVADVEITTPAENETSLGYQERFAQALPDAIIGRSLDEIVVDRLAGASGCSEGFMDALAEIREAARAEG